MATDWQVGDECVVLDRPRVWRIAGFLGEVRGSMVADLVPVGFKFDGTHSCDVRNLRDVPATPQDPSQKEGTS